MNKLFSRVPVLRSILRAWDKQQFDRAWRKRNPHNETIVGNRYFPVEVVTVGKGTYGILTVQSLYVTDKEKLTIGNYVSIAPDVTFHLGVNHQTNTVTTYPFHSKLVERTPMDAISKGPIVVEDEVWIGTGVRIFSGVRIGKGAIIGAGAIVTKDIPPYAIAGGNPARIIRSRFSPEIIEILMPIRFIDIPEDQIRKHITEIYREIKTVEDARHIRALTDSIKMRP